jgi:hypothetical protein
MDQLDIFEFIEEPKTIQGIYAKEQQELIISKDTLVDSLNSREANIVHNAHLCYSNNLEEYKSLIVNLSKTKTYHFSNMKKNIYIYSFHNDEKYYRCYQVKDRILVETSGVDKFTDEVVFPAMCLQMLDIEGKPIHFSNREDFIMKDLGFEKIGKLRCNGLFKKRLFSTIKSTYEELVEYLKRGDAAQ